MKKVVALASGGLFALTVLLPLGMAACAVCGYRFSPSAAGENAPSSLTSSGTKRCRDKSISTIKDRV